VLVNRVPVLPSRTTSFTDRASGGSGLLPVMHWPMACLPALSDHAAGVTETPSASALASASGANIARGPLSLLPPRRIFGETLLQEVECLGCAVYLIVMPSIWEAKHLLQIGGQPFRRLGQENLASLEHDGAGLHPGDLFDADRNGNWQACR
jgi:hypothetical protein